MQLVPHPFPAQQPLDTGQEKPLTAFSSLKAGGKGARSHCCGNNPMCPLSSSIWIPVNLSTCILELETVVQKFSEQSLLWGRRTPAVSREVVFNKGDLTLYFGIRLLLGHQVDFVASNKLILLCPGGMRAGPNSAHMGVIKLWWFGFFPGLVRSCFLLARLSLGLWYTGQEAPGPAASSAPQDGGFDSRWSEAVGQAGLITFAPVWECSDEGEEPKCVRRRKATAISLQPLSETRENMKKKAAQNEKLQENRLHVFHGSQNYMFSNFFFFCMNRIPGFSANFNEHLTKSREKRRHKKIHESK
ncbi:uncharacterized protein WM294_016023 [Sarcoramphus papa]